MKMDAVTVTPPIDSFTFCLSSDSLSVKFLYHHNTIADVKAVKDVNENMFQTSDFDSYLTD